jgi:anti-sigma28 factor (negative regulator of flagellin synthesis)
MKIDNRHLAETSASSGRDQEPAATGRDGQRPESARRSGGGDRLELSPLTGRVAHALAADTTARTARVEQIARDFQSGRYEVDAKQASRALVEEGLGVFYASFYDRRMRG